MERPPFQLPCASLSLPPSLLTPFTRFFSELTLHLVSNHSLHRRYRNCYPTRRHQGQGEGSIAQAEDSRASSTQDGQDRHRLPEAPRRLLQVPDQAQDVCFRRGVSFSVFSSSSSRPFAFVLLPFSFELLAFPTSSKLTRFSVLFSIPQVLRRKRARSRRQGETTWRPLRRTHRSPLHPSPRSSTLAHRYATVRSPTKLSFPQGSWVERSYPCRVSVFALLFRLRLDAFRRRLISKLTLPFRALGDG